MDADATSLLVLGLIGVTAVSVIGMAVWVSVVQRQLARAQQQAQREKRRALGEMAAAFAHTFSNVLTPIIGRAQLVAQRVSDPQLALWLAQIEHSALDGAEMTMRVQEATRIRRDDVRAPFAVNPLVESALALVAARRPKGVQVKTMLGKPGPVAGDAASLREAIAHVIVNAFEAADAGTVTVVTRQEDRESVVSITDVGPGIPSEARPHVFQPFFTTKPDRSGLGLALVYGIVSRHGGQVDIDTAPERGTTVRIRLPIDGAPAPDITVMTPPPERATDGPPRCLLVDDDADVREMLRDVLIGGGYEVVCAADGADGVDRFQAEAFDVVITDFAMPRLNGLQLARVCKSLRPKGRIVMLTGWEVALTVPELAAHGIDTILSKPVKIDDILKAVGALRPAHPKELP